jgi:MoaA/NifB/PqqE/SkfB family radical SAM enzyme
MCEDHSPYGDDRVTRKKQGRIRPTMNVGLLERIIREVAELGFTEIIPSTMGEPLLYPHFDTFLDLCHELGLKLNLTTNGTFPSPNKHQNVEYWAKRIIPIGSDVKISWNGASADVQKDIMLGANIKQHIDNAKRFIAVRDEMVDFNYCSLTMQLTFMQMNLEEIPNIVRLAIELGFDRVKGHQLWTHFPELERQSLRKDVKYARRWNEIVGLCEQIVREHNASSDRKLRLDNFLRLELENLDDISPTGTCPFLNKEIWVDPTGRFNVCCAPDQERRALGDFGNLNNSNVKDIIEGNDYQTLVANYREQPLCKSCNMRRPQ